MRLWHVGINYSDSSTVEAWVYAENAKAAEELLREDNPGTIASFAFAIMYRKPRVIQYVTLPKGKS